MWIHTSRLELLLVNCQTPLVVTKVNKYNLYKFFECTRFTSRREDTTLKIKTKYAVFGNDKKL